MTNTSDGGKEDPPDPPYANKNTTINPPSLYTPAVHSAKKDSVWTEIDRNSPIYNNNTRPPTKSHFASPTTSPPSSTPRHTFPLTAPSAPSLTPRQPYTKPKTFQFRQKLTKFRPIAATIVPQPTKKTIPSSPLISNPTAPTTAVRPRMNVTPPLGPKC